MARAGFEVFDCHHHVGSLEALGLSTGTEGLDPEEALEADLAARLATMDATGVDAALLIPGHGYLRPEGLADTRRVNDRLAAYRARRPDRFPAALGVVEPLYGGRGLAELDRLHDELGMVGVSFHVRFQGVATNSPLVVALVRRMAALGLVPFLHGVAEVADEALWKLQEVARAEPGTTMVVLDGFSSHEQGEQLLRVAEATPNLVFDTSLAPGMHAVGRFLATFGSDRLVYGTDVYSHLTPQHRNRTLDDFMELAMDDDARRAVLSGNLRRILGLAG